MKCLWLLDVYCMYMHLDITLLRRHHRFKFHWPMQMLFAWGANRCLGGRLEQVGVVTCMFAFLWLGALKFWLFFEWKRRTQSRQNNSLCSLHYALTDTCTMAPCETMPQGESKTSNRAQLASEQAEGHAWPAFHPLLPPQQGLAAVLAESKRVSTLKVLGPRVHTAQGLYIISVSWALCQEQSSAWVDRAFLLKQLQGSGVPQLLQVMGQGFPHRIALKEAGVLYALDALFLIFIVFLTEEISE